MTNEKIDAVNRAQAELDAGDPALAFGMLLTAPEFEPTATALITAYFAGRKSMAAQVAQEAQEEKRPPLLPDGPAVHSLALYAHRRGIRVCDVRNSFERMAEAVPEMWDHCEARLKSSGSGRTFRDYYLDRVGYLAWRYWREKGGRIPTGLREDRK